MDSSGNVFVAGWTYSTDFPCTSTGADNTFKSFDTGRNEAFIAKLNANLSSLLAATFLGGSDDDIPFSIALDYSGSVGLFTSIAVDSSGYIHVSYYDAATDDLKYITNASGSWVSSTVDSTGDVGQYTSISVDSTNIHISYYDATNDDLKYATKPISDSSWTISTVDSTGDMGQYTSISLDSGNYAHISYYDVTNGDLKYATNASGSWVTSTEDSTGDVGKYTSIAIDSNNIYISYYNSTYGNLEYATKPISDSLWTISTIDSTGLVGQYTAIAIASNNAHITYYDITNGDLKYATNTSGSWANSTLDNSSNVNVYVSGWTQSSDFPGISSNSADSTAESYGVEGFIAKLDATLNFPNFTATYLGGSDDDFPQKIVFDSSGNLYVTGYTYSSDFPGITQDSAYKTLSGYNDGFVALLKPDLSSILAATFLGGSSNDTPSSTALDSTGNVYVSGMTQSSDFPKVDENSADSIYGSYYEGFIAKLNAGLTLLFSATYLGGSDYDNVSAITIDTSGNIYAAGWTYSSDFASSFPDKLAPVISADTTFAGNNESFVVKLSPSLLHTASRVLNNWDKTVASGSEYPVCWESSSETANFRLMYSMNNGKSWKQITNNISTSNVASFKPLSNEISNLCYEWQIPVVTENKNRCLLKVIEYNSTGSKIGAKRSYDIFTIEVVHLLSPNGEESLQSNTTFPVTWTSKKTKNTVAKAKIYYSDKGGKNWKLITTLSGNPGSFNWSVPSVTSEKRNCKIKVKLLDSRGKTVGSDVSDGNFTIKP